MITQRINIAISNLEHLDNQLYKFRRNNKMSITRKDFIERMNREVSILEETKKEILQENNGELEEYELEDKVRERIEEGILSVDIRKEYDILLSWGGPSDGFKVICNDNNELIEVKYWFADWGEYQEEKLNDEELNTFTEAYGCILESYEITI